MTPLTRPERLFFVVICLSAAAISIPGFFAPAGLASGLSWLELPPLHARFVAAIYLFGVITMLGALVVRRWSQIRTVLLLVVIFTGGILVFSLLNLAAFDFSKPVVWLWFATYISYPLIALFLLWRRSQGNANGNMVPPSLPSWVRTGLLIQGSIVGLIALILLILPTAIIPVWPWNISPRLAQFYSGPLLAYGVGSVIVALRGTAQDIKVIGPAMVGFTISTLLASLVHNSLFSFSELNDLLWFAFFAVISIVLAVITVRAFQVSRA